MSESKHTPGPWIWEKAGKFACDIWSDKNKSTDGNIAVVYNEENARLIAAAPELLELLKEQIVDMSGTFALTDKGEDWLKRASDFLAKAQE